MSAEPAGRIVDAHIHVWSADTDRYPLAPGFNRTDLWLPSFTPADHARYSRAVGPVRMNLVQMTWYGLDHSYIVDLIAQDPHTFVGTGMVSAVSDVRLPDPDKAMVALATRGIYAFRVRGRQARPPLGDGPRWLDHPGYERMFAAGAEHNLALSFLMGVDDIPELDRMCRRFPETPVIIDHVCGIRIKDGLFPETEVRSLCALARHKRVLVKLGPFQALGAGQAPYLDLLPLIRRVVDAFGPERCMWESDSGGPIPMANPRTDYPAAVALVRDHADFLSAADKAALLSTTAERFFFQR